MSAATQADVFLKQAAACDGRSPLYAELCRRFADDPDVADIIEQPPRWDAPLRLLSALHYLVLDGRASWDDVDVALRDEGAFLRGFVAEQTVQTNEVQRCWMLVPCFLEIARQAGAREFNLIELGPSAGLNLVWDRYRYAFEAASWGPEGAALTLGGEERGQPHPASLLAEAPTVRSRVGIELAHIDATTDDGARLLQSFVWPDQTWRHDQIEQAIATLRREPALDLVHGDLLAELPAVLERAMRDEDALTVVWQTFVLEYLPKPERQVARDMIAAAGERGPIAFLESVITDDDARDHCTLELQLWPGGERQVLARADFHGAWIEWLA